MSKEVSLTDGWERISHTIVGLIPEAEVDEDGSITVSYWGKERGHLVTLNLFNGGKIIACYTAPDEGFTVTIAEGKDANAADPKQRG